MFGVITILISVKCESLTVIEKTLLYYINECASVSANYQWGNTDI